MDDNPVDDTNPPVLPSKRKGGNIILHGHKNCKADLLKEESKIFGKCGPGMDEDYRRFLAGDVIPLRTYQDSNHNGDMIPLLRNGDCNDDSDMTPLLTNDDRNGYSDMRLLLRNDESSDNAVNDDDLYEDPHYKIFWDSLRVDGDSFVIEVNEKNGLSEPLKYDAEEGYYDEPDLGNQRQMKTIVEGNVGNGKSDSLSGSELDFPLVFSTTTQRQRRQVLVEDDMSSEHIHSNPIRNQVCLVEKVGNGGTSSSDGKCETNVQSEMDKSQILRNSRNVTGRGKLEATVNVEKKNDHECEEDYHTYMNYLSIEGKKMVLKYKNASPIVYESNELLPNVRRNNRAYPAKKERTLLTANAGGSDVSVIGDGNSLYVGTPSRHSRFREQVMRILSEPYDPEEHQKLSKDILARKPIARNLDLRNGREQTYSTNKDGKSYLDHFYDLKRKLQAAKTVREELNLLRGFFFWLQNLTQEGAFRPWTDKSCLAM